MIRRNKDKTVNTYNLLKSANREKMNKNYMKIEQHHAMSFLVVFFFSSIKLQPISIHSTCVT